MLPTVSEPPADLRRQLAAARDAILRDRLHLLLLVQAGEVTSKVQAAERLARHRNTIAAWLADYVRGGLDALLEIKSAGRPRGQCSIPEPIFEALRARLHEPEGFASYVAVQQWLRDEYELERSYWTVYQIVRQQLGAKLKAPRPVHPKKK